ncbi:MAG: hypothetical protein JW860_14050, partial [Sedimentisphaerales bacterium]|nr:hypothetical protein [Sedimentisphaerales bacterium]
MANQSYYQKKSNYQGRRFFLLATFLLVIFAAIWKIIPSVHSNESPDLTASMETAAQDPVITVPRSSQQSRGEPEVSLAMAAPSRPLAQEKPEAEIAPVVSAAPRPVQEQPSSQAEILLQQARQAFTSGDYLSVRRQMSRIVT